VWAGAGVHTHTHTHTFKILLQGVFYTQWQTGSSGSRKEHDIAKGKTCIHASLNTNNLEEAVVLLTRAVPISASKSN
jgi:hypothetical protein